MKHSTTNFRAIKKLIDAHDKRVRNAHYKNWFGEDRWFVRNGDMRIEVGLDHEKKTARPLRIAYDDGFEIRIYQEQFCNKQRVSEADALLHDWLYPKEQKRSYVLDGFQSLI